ncbi:hypothetical protein BC834DRAFT_966913 [Gloeopeniophorella convolvens]|nr:hypothetical protein BC834DRAFT_966913 [Gloeopeniophorella convolvens]
MEPLFRPPAKQSIFALYRSYLRQVRLLPHEYLRQFFRLKSHDDVLSALDHSRRIKQRSSTYRRLRKDCARLERANNADKKAFEYILDLAYGRKGPLKWSIMKPLLSDPTAPAPDRIISAVEYSRPPVYSPELAALLVSDLARPAGRTLKQHHLDKPPTLPPRADPSSAEARLFGPLSKRREVNLRWRFFADQWKRLYPPLEVSVRSRGARQSSSQEDAISDARIRPVGMQTAELLDELQALAGPVSQRSPHPRKLDPVYQPQAKPAISDGRRLPTSETLQGWYYYG